MITYTDTNESYLALRIDIDNMENVAKWSGGSVRGVLLPAHRRIVQLQTYRGEVDANVGDWIVLRIGTKTLKPYWDAYTDNVFHDLYMENRS